MGHYDFQLLDAEGMPYGDLIQVISIKGVLLLCPPKINVLDTEHICELARQTPDYPHDLCIWEGPDPNPYLQWSARIHYRTNANVEG